MIRVARMVSWGWGFNVHGFMVEIGCIFMVMNFRHEVRNLDFA